MAGIDGALNPVSPACDAPDDTGAVVRNRGKPGPGGVPDKSIHTAIVPVECVVQSQLVDEGRVCEQLAPQPCAVGDTVRFQDLDVTECDIEDEEYVLVDSQHVMMKWPGA